MRRPAALALIVVFALGAQALAHGGCFGDGPPQSLPPGLREPLAPPAPPDLSCDCARPDCKHCSDGRIAARDRLARCEIVERSLRRWNDFAALELTATFRARRNERPVEACALLAPAGVFAATGGRIRAGNAELAASLRPAKNARRRYLWARRLGLDPFLVIRRDPGRYYLRAFPVRADADTVVTITGFALAPPRERGAMRFYRTGERVLVVRDTLPGRPLEKREWEDAEGGRALAFFDAGAARRRFGASVDRAPEVSFVPAIETAIHNKGSAATGNERVLLALPQDAPPPPPAPTPAES